MTKLLNVQNSLNSKMLSTMEKAHLFRATSARSFSKGEALDSRHVATSRAPPNSIAVASRSRDARNWKSLKPVAAPAQRHLNS